ncbi:MAG TPA: hypothetical protein VLW45_12695 [Pelomicrobium sp.]|nr:hypothetical protein [Pelomicrobium sp.]
MEGHQLSATFDRVDAELADLERALAAEPPPPLAATVERATALVRELIVAYLADEGKKAPPPADADILDVWKVLVKGEPYWNTIRDNLRELVYYRNCIELNRTDALPVVPEKMAVRTARHVYLFIRTRCIREGRIAA